MNNNEETNGLYLFTQDVSLYYNSKDETETVQLEFNNLEVSVIVPNLQFEMVSPNHAGEKKKGKRMIVRSFRKLERPGILYDYETHKYLSKLRKPEEIVVQRKGEKITVKGIRSSIVTDKNSLIMEMLINSDINKSEIDWLTIKLSMILIDGTEYLLVEPNCRTQIEIISNTEIHYG